MKKQLIIIGAIGLVVVAVIAGFGIMQNGTRSGDATQKEEKTNASNAASRVAVDACQLFTEADAKAVLGPQATAGTQSAPASTPGINVSTCSYTNNATAVADIRVITVMVRSALDDDGVKSNKAVFGDGKPAGSQAVSGYGTEAYFTPALGQLNILDNDNWIIVSNGSAQAGKNTLADAKLVADKLK